MVSLEKELTFDYFKVPKVIFNRQISSNGIWHFPKPAENYFKNSSNNVPLKCFRESGTFVTEGTPGQSYDLTLYA
jgi:hypothetical protein